MEDFKCRTFAVKDGLLITAWGDVYTYNYRNTGKFKKLSANLDKHGYPYVTYGYKHKYVHRLVAEAFLPNPENKPEVDHINACPSDCRVSNLRWTTASENQRNPITLERMSKAMTNHQNTSKKVYQYTLDGEYIREWPSVKEVERVLGLSDSVVGDCCRGGCTHAGDFQFSYVKHERMGPAVTNKKKVYQYNLDGTFVREWRSQSEIEEELGFRQADISACCNGKQKYAHGHIWSFDYTDSKEPVATIKKKVYQYSREGMFVREWESAAEAERQCGRPKGSHINECCIGKVKSAYGFIWSYSPLS